MNKAPWPDFKGNPIYEGDKITHPSGEYGRVVFKPGELHPGDAWRVDYGTSHLSRLCLQIGDKGMGVVTCGDPATDTRPVQTFAMVRQRVDPKLSGFSPCADVYLTAFTPVTVIDFYPAPADSGYPTQRK